METRPEDAERERPRNSERVRERRGDDRDGRGRYGASQGAAPLQWAKVLAWLALGGFLVVLSLAAAGLYRRAARLLEDPGGAIFGAASKALATATPRVQAGPAMLLRLQGASELTTALHDLQTVVEVEQERRLGDFTVGSTRLLYVGVGQVRAGIDLSQLGPGAFSDGPEGLTVNLPAPRILDKKLDVERSYVFDQERSLLGPLDPSLQSQAERAALEQILLAACSQGILPAAAERAELAVRLLLQDAVPGTVRVRVAPPDAGECP